MTSFLLEITLAIISVDNVSKSYSKQSVKLYLQCVYSTCSSSFQQLVIDRRLLSPPNWQGPKMKQYMDVFSIPEMTLLAATNDFFISNDIEYDPVHLYRDVSVSASFLSILLCFSHSDGFHRNIQCI